MTELPKATMDKILRKAGAKRISDDAKIELAKVLEEIGEEIGKEAVPYAKHAGRKTVRAEDIQLVINQESTN